MSCNDDRPLVVAFGVIGNGTWQGGINYQRSLLTAIYNRKSEMIAQVFVPPQLERIAREEFQDLLHLPIIVDHRCARGGLSFRTVVAAILGSDYKFAEVLQDNSVDLVFESASYFGWRFPINKLTWIPDFQHRALPRFFGFSQWLKREAGFLLALHLGGRNTILVSSESAKQDCLKFYRVKEKRIVVMHFLGNFLTAKPPNINWANEEIRKHTNKDIDLGKGFFFLPNQYWEHKNHIKVIEALIELKSQGFLEKILPVILTGDTKDSRTKGLFDAHMTVVRDHGLENIFLHLNKVSFELVQNLHFYSTALINPSLFEGWSTTVEEAKILNSDLILSDLPVHREQAPDAIFFDPNNAESLATQLKLISEQELTSPKDWLEVQTNFKERSEWFSDSLAGTIRLAVG